MYQASAKHFTGTILLCIETMITPMIQKLRLRKGETLVQGHTARPWSKPDQGLVDSLLCHPGKWLHLSELQLSQL